MKEIKGVVRALREGDDAAKVEAAHAMVNLSMENAVIKDMIVKAGGIPPLVELLRDGSVEAKQWAADALGNLAHNHDASKVLIAEAGGIAPLVDLLRNGNDFARSQAAWALRFLSRNNDANKVELAVAVGLEALVELARRGDVTVDNWSVLPNASVPAKRKAALVVAALLGDCVPDSVPREIKAIIGPYL